MNPQRFVLPGVLAMIQIMGSVGAGSEQPERRGIDLLAVVLLLAGPAALAFLRRRPVVMAVVAMAVTVTYYVVGYPYGPVFASLAVALYWLVASGGRVAGWLIAGVGLAGATGLQAAVGRGNPWPVVHFAAVAGWLVTVLVVGEIGRVRGERLAEARKARAEEERRRASEERLQIAQELHDVLAHNISLISVQAGVGLHLLDDQPEKAREAFVAIKAASRDALGELRSVLDLLRGTDQRAPRSPTAGLEQLGRVVAKAAATGLDVQVETVGAARDLPPEVDLAALRIAQEALTNVARHSGATHARVRVTYGRDDLVVEVDDDGRGVAGGAVAAGGVGGAGGGKGITGMRERAAALGGSVDAGPGPSGGFRVVARLPVPVSAAAGPAGGEHGLASASADTGGAATPDRGTPEPGPVTPDGGVPAAGSSDGAGPEPDGGGAAAGARRPAADDGGGAAAGARRPGAGAGSAGT